jgi:hypothetical protein
MNLWWVATRRILGINGYVFDPEGRISIMVLVACASVLMQNITDGNTGR